MNGKPDIDPVIGAKLRAFGKAITSQNPLIKALDAKPLAVGVGKTRISFFLDDSFLDADGSIHSGFMTIVIDTLLGMTSYTATENAASVATINLKTDHHKSAKPGLRAICEAECVSFRNEVAQMRGAVTDEETGDLLASATGAFMVTLQKASA